jgi:hypothetical protein
MSTEQSPFEVDVTSLASQYGMDWTPGEVLNRDYYGHFAVQLYRNGHPLSKIAALFDVTRDQVKTLLKEKGYDTFAPETVTTNDEMIKDVPNYAGDPNFAHDKTGLVYSYHPDTVPDSNYPKTLSALLGECQQLSSVDRQAIYGDFHEDLKLQGQIMSAFRDAGINQEYSEAHNKAIEYVVGKLVRIARGRFHFDNYRDLVNYAGQAGISELKERGVI